MAGWSVALGLKFDWKFDEFVLVCHHPLNKVFENVFHDLTLSVKSEIISNTEFLFEIDHKLCQSRLSIKIFVFLERYPSGGSCALLVGDTKDSDDFIANNHEMIAKECDKKMFLSAYCFDPHYNLQDVHTMF